MLARLRELRRKDSGFTLTELLIVIVILGVLAGIVVIAVSNFNDRGHEAACRTSVSTVEDAAELFHASESAYPGEGGDGTAPNGDTYDTSAADSDGRLHILVQSGYLKDEVDTDGYDIILDEFGQVTTNPADCSF